MNQTAHDVFRNFVAWAGSQKRAAEFLGCNESTVSLIVSEKRGISPDMALRVESASKGLFKREAVLWGEAA